MSESKFTSTIISYPDTRCYFDVSRFYYSMFHNIYIYPMPRTGARGTITIPLFRTNYCHSFLRVFSPIFMCELRTSRSILTISAFPLRRSPQHRRFVRLYRTIEMLQKSAHLIHNHEFERLWNDREHTSTCAMDLMSAHPMSFSNMSSCSGCDELPDHSLSPTISSTWICQQCQVTKSHSWFPRA